MRRHAAALWLFEKALLRQQLAVLSRQFKRPDLTSSDLCWLRIVIRFADSHAWSYCDRAGRLQIGPSILAVYDKKS